MSKSIMTVGVKSLSTIFMDEGLHCSRDVQIDEIGMHPIFVPWAGQGFTHVHMFREASRPDIEIDHGLFLVDAKYIAAKYDCECVFSDIATMSSGRKAVFLKFLKAQPSPAAE